MKVETRAFRANASRALDDEGLRTALSRSTGAMRTKREAAVAAMADFETLRTFCGEVKAHTLDHLDYYLAQLADAIEARGGHVHFAPAAADAVRYVERVAQEHGATTAVKSKSMLSEEIGLNDALERAGVEPVETDLGEYILQLAGDVPSHIIAPVIHRTREDITALFHRELGTPLDADVEQLTAAARGKLRRAFLDAGMGITGANFAVAETGTIVLVENEGNIRLTTSTPRVHVAVMGMEKVIPRLADLPAFLRVLPRSATGQKASSYVSLITGPKRPGDPEGPESFHLVIVDNGRSDVLADPAMRDALRCIRCGACLNVCPVYQHVGGHAYGWVYGGPIGAVLDPVLLGLDEAKSLPQASSLCGACGDVCPVRIPLPDLLVEHRKRSVERGLVSRSERAAIGAFAFAASRPKLWNTGSHAARAAARLLARDGYLGGTWLPVLREWLRERDLAAPPARTFRDVWREELADGDGAEVPR